MLLLFDSYSTIKFLKIQKELRNSTRTDLGFIDEKRFEHIYLIFLSCRILNS